jgi:hypothetical protein
VGGLCERGIKLVVGSIFREVLMLDILPSSQDVLLELESDTTPSPFRYRSEPSWAESGWRRGAEDGGASRSTSSSPLGTIFATISISACSEWTLHLTLDLPRTGAWESNMHQASDNVRLVLRSAQLDPHQHPCLPINLHPVRLGILGLYTFSYLFFLLYRLTWKKSFSSHVGLRECRIMRRRQRRGPCPNRCWLESDEGQKITSNIINTRNALFFR